MITFRPSVSGTPALARSSSQDHKAAVAPRPHAACYARLTGVPAWAALSAARLHLLAIPENVKTIVIAEDNDPEGMRAAVRAKQVYTEQGFTVRRHSPRPHGDWAEVPIGS